MYVSKVDNGTILQPCITSQQLEAKYGRYGVFICHFVPVRNSAEIEQQPPHTHLPKHDLYLTNWSHTHTHTHTHNNIPFIVLSSTKAYNNCLLSEYPDVVVPFSYFPKFWISKVASDFIDEAGDIDHNPVCGLADLVNKALLQTKNK